MGKFSEEAGAGERGHEVGNDGHASAMSRRQLIRPAFKAVFQFARFMITLPVVVIRGRRGNVDEVTVYSAHPSFFLWVLIVVGFVSGAGRRTRAAVDGLFWVVLCVGTFVLSGHLVVRLQYAQVGAVGVDLWRSFG